MNENMQDKDINNEEKKRLQQVAEPGSDEQKRRETLIRALSEGTPDDIVERYFALPELAAETDFGEYDSNVVVLDTETTGVSIYKDELTQIAAARIEHGEVIEWFVTFVNPGRHIADEIAHLTNIHDEDVSDAPTPQEALAQLVEFVGDAKIVAHNANFDLNFTTKHPEGYPLLDNLWLDSLDLARICLPRMKSHRLIDLVKAFDAPLSTHRADEDVAATCALYRILLAGIASMPKPLVREISQLAPQSEWSTGAAFAYFANREIGTKGAETAGIAEAVGVTETAGIAERAESAERAEAAKSPTIFDVAKGSLGNIAENVSHETFSLREMRRHRITKRELHPKNDAAAMISAELAQKAGIQAENATLSFPTEEEISRDFSESGLMAAMFSDYQPRDEQSAMAQAVRKAFATSDNLMVEAGTGVGKSMAYLLPAALTAIRNNINIGIATKTNALLDQLVFHELPALASALENETGEKLTFAALKGFTHYPCLRKVQRIVQNGSQIRQVAGEEKSNAPAIAGLLSYIEQTEYDDMDHLRIDFRMLPRRAISITSNECLRRKCPFYGASCFVHGLRRVAEASDIVVTNHSLLFCDVAADFSLLPPVRYLVIDEAHSAQDEARRALSLTICVEDLNRLARKVSGEDLRENVFKRAERNVVVPHDLKLDAEMMGEFLDEPIDASYGGMEDTPASVSESVVSAITETGSDMFDVSDFATLFYGLLGKAQRIAAQFSEAEAEFAARIRDMLFFDTQKRSGYEYVDIWINDEVRSSTIFAKLRDAGKDVSCETERLISACQKLVALLENIPNAAGVQREIASITLELKDFLHAAEEILFKGSPEYVYSATLSRRAKTGAAQSRGTEDRLCAQLYNVGAKLNETLYASTHSVVFASATLTIADSFSSFEQAMGLNTEEQSHATGLILPSSYDYDENMKVYVIRDLPEPNMPGYLEELQRLLEQLHLAQGGSMLTLFTNRHEMEACYESVNPTLKRNDLRLVCQKWGVTTKGLRDEFLENEKLSLFALKSFWEGFDAPGSTLRGVVIPKLPFQKPTDPLSRERDTRDNHAWRTYSLPQAVLEVKQAAGRLIRKSTDRGILVLADSRIISKSYGKTFLKSLPSKNICYATCEEAIADIAKENTES